AAGVARVAGHRPTPAPPSPTSCRARSATEACPLSLHDALPILRGGLVEFVPFDDPYTTNLCFGGADMRTAWITLSSRGQLVEVRSEEHTSELQSRENLVCRLLLEKQKRPGRARPEGARGARRRP